MLIRLLVASIIAILISNTAILAQDEQFPVPIQEVQLQAAECHMQQLTLPTVEEAQEALDAGSLTIEGDGAYFWIRKETVAGYGLARHNVGEIEEIDLADIELSEINVERICGPGNIFQTIRSFEPIQGNAIQAAILCLISEGPLEILMPYSVYQLYFELGYISTVENELGWVYDYENEEFLAVNSNGEVVEYDEEWNFLQQEDSQDEYGLNARCYELPIRLNAHEVLEGCQAEEAGLISEEEFLQLMADGTFPSPWLGYLWVQKDGIFILYDATVTPPLAVHSTITGEIPSTGINPYLAILGDCSDSFTPDA